MGSTQPGTTPYYYVPADSSRPFWSAFGLFFFALGAGQWVNGVEWGQYSFFLGLGIFLYVLYRWFGDAIRESEGGMYSRKIDLSYRWSMSWFIFSEVCFFAAFFTALWWARSHALPQLAGADHAILWEGFKGEWASVVAGATGSPTNTIEPFTAMRAVNIGNGIWETIMGSLPTVNTLLLLTSGVTLTIAHHALLDDNRSKTLKFMWLTVLLGVVFLYVQGYEYYHAYDAMNLKLTSGTYGSTFYLLTGFHGFHVLLGVLMLFFITIRLHKGHFNSKKHFGFEGAAWYWHFVDVVWLGLYVLVYWL